MKLCINCELMLKSSTEIYVTEQSLQFRLTNGTE